MKAVLIPISGEPRWVEPEIYPGGEPGEADEPDLKWLYRTIGCKMVQRIQTHLGDLWLDEEGKLTEEPYNEIANELFSSVLFPDDCLVGNVVLIPYVETENTVRIYLESRSVITEASTSQAKPFDIEALLVDEPDGSPS